MKPEKENKGEPASRKIGNMNKPAHLSKPRRYALLGSMLVFIVLILVWWQAGIWYEDQLLDELEAQEIASLTLHGKALSGAIEHRLYILEGLAAFVLFNPSEDALEQNFEGFASNLYSGTEGVLYFTVAPAGVQQYIYPDAYENILKNSLTDDHKLQSDIQRAIQTEQVILSGPHGMQENNLSMVAIRAIYIDNTLWGFATMGFDVPFIFSEAGLDLPDHPNIAIRDAEGHVFYGDEAIFERNPVVQPIEIANNYWELAVLPEEGHATIEDRVLIFRGTGLIIILLLTLLAYLTINRQTRLSLEVRERTEELSKVNKEIMAANEMKDLFTDIMRHDLLNPANIIRGYTDVLLNMEDEDKKVKSLETIKRNNEKLINMIESAARFSKLESVEEIEFEKLDIVSVFREVIDNFRPQIEEKQMSIEFKPSGKYLTLANPVIEEVFANLLSNAIKYSPDEEKIIIDIRDYGEKWKVSITDFGVGIPDEDKPKLFERFKRVDKSGVKGTGLGLAIVKRIIDLHDGKVGVEDNPAGKGSVFWVTLNKA
ncbi:integral membrane sensor signal transduction histidine kinase [Methanosalsum zhilinae DSM 4017]|uniref:histidine kinase n=2 Tax=Methanosalsum zhilinae TaxID=39669 RepID=F7XPM6_METZD|nr:integral membrane sensor signal transduction histidine kinase [Methanosalsum zhilinae DSM 4017]